MPTTCNPLPTLAVNFLITMHRSEILMHLGEDREQYFHAVAPPIIQSSNFTFSHLKGFRQAMSDELAHHIYTRGNNPTVAILRQKLAALEGTEDALVLSSGSAAVALAVLSQVQSGDHIVCVRKPYSWTHKLLAHWLPRFGVHTTFVDGTHAAHFEQALRPNTKLIYLESPNSLTFELQDLATVAQIAKAHGIVTAIDNSHCSPIFQQPARFGIDIVIHSGTKYLNGHSDVVNGVICTSRQIIQTIFQNEFMTLGAIISPHDAWLILRGLRTLELRMQRSEASARKVAAFLQEHPRIRQVLHPLMPDFPQYALARKQMSGSGGLFSFLLDVNTLEDAERFFTKLKRFLLAVSWGGYESLILPSAAFYRIPGKPDPPLPFQLVRIYVGLEDPQWLIEDLAQALDNL